MYNDVIKSIVAKDIGLVKTRQEGPGDVAGFLLLSVEFATRGPGSFLLISSFYILFRFQ